MKKLILSLSLLFIFSGCASYKNTFPAEISSVANGCKNDSKVKIQSKGKSLSVKADCRVSEVAGTKNYNGTWCWYDARWNAYVGGTCSGSFIQIGCNPKNKADVNPAILTHEMAHHWLISNYNNYKHDIIYDNLFINWKLSRDVAGSSVEFGKTYSGIYTNELGEVTHVDFVRLE